MSERLRLGVIGAGLKAAEYARSWTRMPEIEFVAVADTVEASRQRLIDVCEAAGAPAPVSFVSYRAMLEACKGDLELLEIAQAHCM